jgi:hypothetical protein
MTYLTQRQKIIFHVREMVAVILLEQNSHNMLSSTWVLICEELLLTQLDTDKRIKLMFNLVQYNIVFIWVFSVGILRIKEN